MPAAGKFLKTTFLAQHAGTDVTIATAGSITYFRADDLCAHPCTDAWTPPQPQYEELCVTS